MGTPRRGAWILFVVGLVFFFLAALKTGGVAPSLPSWFEDAGLCCVALGAAMWAFPYQPPGTPGTV